MSTAQAVPTAEAAAERCSHADCTNILDTTGLPKWCRSCRAAYQREYQALRVDRKQQVGFAQGREAMRDMVVAEFARLGLNQFSGDEVAHLVARMPGPQVFDSGDSA